MSGQKVTGYEIRQDESIMSQSRPARTGERYHTLDYGVPWHDTIAMLL